MQTPTYAAPPPTYTCVICGSPDGATVKTFTKTYTPWWVWFTILAGLVPAAIVALVVQTRHRLQAPICSRCHLKQRVAPLVSLVALLLAIGSLFGGLVVALALKSWVVGVVGVLVAIAIAILAGRFDKSRYPRFVKLDAHNVVIHDPIHGPIVLVAPQYGQF